jgi:hypothetical protein
MLTSSYVVKKNVERQIACILSGFGDSWEKARAVVQMQTALTFSHLFLMSRLPFTDHIDC